MITRDKFEELVGDGLDAIPEKFRRKLSNVAIIVEDEPTPEQRRKLKLRRDHDLFGLYEGVPQTARGDHYYWVLPDKITIFRKAMLTYARDAGEVRRMVRDTVWHEIAHHFGMDEREVRRREGKRRT
ncbi:MAG: metallopeptidase family protein [bacterium]|nr:metallopeptidase family protein [bacterium]